MDFGENLKRARESKGLTQQHLADKLYVTRQAVSKWECGTRYPDLITTKCIANILDVSIDSLVSNDEVKDFSEKQSIMNNQKGEKIITIIYAILSVLSFVRLVQCSISTCIHFSDNTLWNDTFSVMMIVSRILLYLLVAGISAFALMKSIKDRITPKIAGLIGIIYYGYFVLEEIIIMVFNGFVPSMIAETVIALGLMILIYAYFFCNKNLSKVIYVGCIISSIYFVVNPIYSLISLVKYNVSEMTELTNLTNIVNIFTGVGFVLILLAQTIVLERKRKLCKDFQKE